MSSEKSRRFLFEFLAIFAGVTLGLLADDWRQRRDDAREAGEALALIHDDLVADSLLMHDMRGHLENHKLATHWLQQHWHDPFVELDSIGQVFRTYLFVNEPKVRRTAYESLKDGRRLALIRDDSLRILILDYYENAQTEMRFYADYHYRNRQAFFEGAFMDHALVRPGGEQGEVIPVAPGPFELTSSWTEIAADNRVYNQATYMGMAADLAVQYIDQAQEANVALRRSILEAR